ncbi:unnamed protein product, partial [Nesidiocoris tenuis]
MSALFSAKTLVCFLHKINKIFISAIAVSTKSPRSAVSKRSEFVPNVEGTIFVLTTPKKAHIQICNSTGVWFVLYFRHAARQKWQLFILFTGELSVRILPTSPESPLNSWIRRTE